MDKPEDVKASCASTGSTADTVMVLVQFETGTGAKWLKVPSLHDALFVSSGHPLPWYEGFWVSYMTTVRDLMLAGF